MDQGKGMTRLTAKRFRSSWPDCLLRPERVGRPGRERRHSENPSSPTVRKGPRRILEQRRHRGQRGHRPTGRSTGSRFEVLVDPQAAQAIKDGKDIDLTDKLALDQVFKDAKKGDKISDEHLEKTFHTRDLGQIAKQIVLKGEVQVTTEQRHQLQAREAHARSSQTIARNAMNPQTGAPHPAARIEAAMTEAKVHVDPFRPVDAQVQEVLAKLRPLLPIRLDVVRVRIRLPAQHYPRVIGEPEGDGQDPGGAVARRRHLVRDRRNPRGCADRPLREAQRAHEGGRRDRVS